jgi:hypothetical protein
MTRAAHARPAEGSAPGEPSPEREWQAGCDRCGASYTLGGWLGLAIVAHVESAWLATHVMGWRAEEVIEVRRCARCGTAMSRRRRESTMGSSNA